MDYLKTMCGCEVYRRRQWILCTDNSLNETEYGRCWHNEIVI